MTRQELAMGSVTFLAVIVLGFFSARWVEHHYAAGLGGIPPASACVTPDGSWKNWVWANVPALSPKCD